MFLFLLPLIFNPFSFIVRWLPALYLAAWPIIIQTLGKEALVLHAVLLIIFILTCDIVRGYMLRLIGFDLISMPAAVLLLALLVSKGNSGVISWIVPISGTILSVIEPIILILETYILMDILRKLNRWISRLSNVRDEDSSDLSTWEPPLTRRSLFMRLVVILLTLLSYTGSYLIIGEAKQLLEIDDQTMPVHFHHAISLLVTLQLISLTSTVYKEAGVLSESAMVALAASIPIFIASWSYYHIKTTAAGSSWTSYFPFSLFSGSGTANSAGIGSLDSSSSPLSSSTGSSSSSSQKQRIVFDDGHLDAYQSSGAFGFGNNYYYNQGHQLDYGALERSIHLISPTDSVLKQAFLAFFRQLIMLINSMLGLSWDKLAQYYFGPDFWYILAGRIVCLIWYITTMSKASASASSSSSSSRRLVAEREDSSSAVGAFRRLGSFGRSLPVSRATIVKCLFVLVYAQMLIKELEDKLTMSEQANLFVDVTGATSATTTGQHSCCSSASQPGLLESSTSWLQCVWNSAQACAGSSPASAAAAVPSSRATRFLEATLGFFGQCINVLLALLAYGFNRVANLRASLHYIYALWLIRWRSSIIQRLMQSVLIQIYYICSILLTGDDDDEEDDD